MKRMIRTHLGWPSMTHLWEYHCNLDTLILCDHYKLFVTLSKIPDWHTPPWTEDAFVEDIVEDLTKVGDTKLKKDVVKEEFPTLLRTLSANVEDLEKKKFNSFSISSKRGTYYINETVEENGDRKTHFQEVARTHNEYALDISYDSTILEISCNCSEIKL